MEEQAYRVWWALHVRVAQGETLDEDEARHYQAGLQQLDAEEAETVPSTLPIVELLIRIEEECYGLAGRGEGAGQ